MVEIGDFTLPLNNIVCCTSLLATDTQPCVCVTNLILME